MFDFVAKKWWWFTLSALLIIPGIIFLALGGLKPGIDFTGGSELELRITQASNITEALQAQAETEGLELDKVIVAGNDHYLLRFRQLAQPQATAYIERLQSGLGQVEQISFINVGPTISGSLDWRSFLYGIGLPLTLLGINIPTSNIAQAIGGIFWASVAITFYIAFAFRKIPKPYSSWTFGFSAIVGLVHDVLFVIGAFAILGYFFNIEIDTSFVTALLTVIGFSVHDTIVVFDRIRENSQRYSNTLSFDQIVNLSVVETLGRSVSTSLTVVLVLASLFLIGGESIRWFVFALLIGTVAGTYSSIFNAAQVLSLWEDWRLRRSQKSNKPTSGAIATKRKKTNRTTATGAKSKKASSAPSLATS